jgi:hypothetical protein
MRLLDWLLRRFRPGAAGQEKIPESVWEEIPGGPTRQLVLSKIKRLFPDELEVEVIQTLDKYGVEDYERERERVQLAILKLSGGDRGELTQWVEMAKTDYRDALAMAEYPEQMKTGAAYFNTDTDTLRRIEIKDREQYLAWLQDENGTQSSRV